MIFTPSEIKRGHIFVWNWNNIQDGSMEKARPSLVVQAEKNSPYAIIVVIRDATKRRLPCHVFVEKDIGNLDKDSLIDCGHIVSVRKDSLSDDLVGTLPESYFTQIEEALHYSLNLSK